MHTPDLHFGSAVALSIDGGRAAVGARGPDLPPAGDRQPWAYGVRAWRYSRYFLSCLDAPWLRRGVSNKLKKNRDRARVALLPVFLELIGHAMVAPRRVQLAQENLRSRPRMAAVPVFLELI